LTFPAWLRHQTTNDLGDLSHQETIGHVEAPDAESAIKDAIKHFGIGDPEQPERLAVTPRGSFGDAAGGERGSG
jgi:hypothetical protein